MNKIKKLLLVGLTFVCVLCAGFAFASCGDNGNGDTNTETVDSGYNLEIETVYAMAQEAGYTGTLEDLIALFKGEQGIQGEKGEKGDRGEQGVQGEKGEKGDQGEQGVQGEKGEKGDQGEQGIQGEKGEKGDQGEQGVQGEKGEKGDQGVGIESATINENGELVIKYTDGKEINLGKVVGEDGQDGSNSSDSSIIIENEQGLDFYLLNDGTYGVSVGNAKYLANIVIPSTYKGKAVTQIIEKGFEGCKNLISIKIPDSLLAIGEGAFNACSNLTNIEISDSIISIGRSAFYNCNKLQYNEKNNLKYLGNENNPYVYLVGTTSTSIVSANIDENCKVIGSDAFNGCISLTNIKIPSGITSICNYAFAGCQKLGSIELSNDLIYIGSGAFMGCNSLTSIIFNGVMEEWNSIKKDLDWNNNTGAYTVYCTDGKITK